MKSHVWWDSLWKSIRIIIEYVSGDLKKGISFFSNSVKNSPKNLCNDAMYIK